MDLQCRNQPLATRKALKNSSPEKGLLFTSHTATIPFYAY